MHITIVVRRPMSGEHHRLGYIEESRSMNGPEMTYVVDRIGTLRIYDGPSEVAAYATESWSSVQARRH